MSSQSSETSSLIMYAHKEALTFNDENLIEISFRNMVWFYKDELILFLNRNNEALNESEKVRLLKHGILYKQYKRINNVKKPEYKLSKKTMKILNELNIDE